MLINGVDINTSDVLQFICFELIVSIKKKLLKQIVAMLYAPLGVDNFKRV